MLDDIVCIILAFITLMLIFAFFVHLFEQTLRGLFISAICIIIVMVSLYFLHKIDAYKYTDASYEIKNMEVLYQVDVDSFEKEKGKEGVYKITLTLYDAPFFNVKEFTRLTTSFSDKITTSRADLDILHVVLSETEYEELIGSGNNLFRTHISSLYLKTEKNFLSAEKMVLYRIEPFSPAFTEKEAKELSDVFLKVANEELAIEDAYNNEIIDIVVY